MYQSKVYKESVGEEQSSEPTEFLRKRKTAVIIFRDFCQCHIGDFALGDFNERTAEEIAEAHTEGRQSKTRHILHIVLSASVIQVLTFISESKKLLRI